MAAKIRGLEQFEAFRQEVSAAVKANDEMLELKLLALRKEVCERRRGMHELSPPERVADRMRAWRKRRREEVRREVLRAEVSRESNKMA